VRSRGASRPGVRRLAARQIPILRDPDRPGAVHRGPGTAPPAPGPGTAAQPAVPAGAAPPRGDRCGSAAGRPARRSVPAGGPGSERHRPDNPVMVRSLFPPRRGTGCGPDTCGPRDGPDPVPTAGVVCAREDPRGAARTSSTLPFPRRPPFPRHRGPATPPPGRPVGRRGDSVTCGPPTWNRLPAPRRNGCGTPRRSPPGSPPPRSRGSARRGRSPARPPGVARAPAGDAAVPGGLVGDGRFPGPEPDSAS